MGILKLKVHDTKVWGLFVFSLSLLTHPFLLFVVFVQLLSHVQLFATPWTLACKTPLSSTVSWSLLKFMFIESVMLS